MGNSQCLNWKEKQWTKKMLFWKNTGTQKAALKKDDAKSPTTIISYNENKQLHSTIDWQRISKQFYSFIKNLGYILS